MANPGDPLAPPITQGAQGPPAPQHTQAPHVPQVPHLQPLTWSHFKPKFSGKPDKHAEAHLLRMNDWMDTHSFQDDEKVQRFCLTLTGEARLWYESLRLINADWIGLQNSFRQQYSKICNTRNNFSTHGDFFILMKMWR